MSYPLHGPDRGRGGRGGRGGPEAPAQQVTRVPAVRPGDRVRFTALLPGAHQRQVQHGTVRAVAGALTLERPTVTWRVYLTDGRVLRPCEVEVEA